MSQQTFTPGGTQVAEPPAPVLPAGDPGAGDDNRRKLMVVGAAVGVLVVAIAGFFLLKGGGSSSADNFVVPHHTPRAAAAPAQAPVVKLPKHVAAPVGRDPFKALYTAPAAAAAPSAAGGSTSTTTSTAGTTTTTTSGGTTSTPTTTTTSYHPVWVQLKSFTTTAATFDVGYSNGKTLKAVQFSGVKPLQTFGRSFELLSIRNGVVTLKYGDGSPFQLDKSRNTMVVD